MVSITQYNVESIVPRRLVFIPEQNYCQFCDTGKGYVICHFVSLHDNYGFMSCDNCSSIAEKHTDNWIATHCYGSAKHLRNRSLKIRRSSGSIDDGWFLDDQRTMVYKAGDDDCVSCVKREEDLQKLVRISALLELNSAE
jgi:hypothetical protein